MYINIYTSIYKITTINSLLPVLHFEYYSELKTTNRNTQPKYEISKLVYVVLYILIAKIFRRKDITLTRNRVIRICIQNTPVPPIAGYF